jgi:hypothetical protein
VLDVLQFLINFFFVYYRYFLLGGCVDRGIVLLYEGEEGKMKKISHVEELGFHTLLKLKSHLWKSQNKNIQCFIRKLIFSMVH